MTPGVELWTPTHDDCRALRQPCAMTTMVKQHRAVLVSFYAACFYRQHWQNAANLHQALLVEDQTMILPDLHNTFHTRAQTFDT